MKENNNSKGKSYTVEICIETYEGNKHNIQRNSINEDIIVGMIVV